MVNQYEYAYYAFLEALDCLATGTEPIQKRLEYAYISKLINLHKPDEDLPPELRTAYRQLRDWWLTSRQPKGDEGSVRASTQQLSDDQAVYCAQVLVKMFRVLHRYEILAAPDEPPLELPIEFQPPD